MSIDLLAALRQALSDDPQLARPAGIEIRQDLTPAGGMPVQPPSYEGDLEIHKRHCEGEVRDAIEIDTVGSAANRMEEALLELHRSGAYPLPVSSTTLTPKNSAPISITTLEMPHRVFDAWLRLSEASDGSGGKFEDSDHGRELSLAHVGELDPLLETSAHDLLFGVWDSHRKGPHGQVRIGRSLTTTLIGFDPIKQVPIAARRDPVNLGEGSDIPKAGKKEKLSEQGLSSIPPQRGRDGVAITSAQYLGFLSFASLRRLGFKRYDPVETRVLLALLGLYALLLRSAAGWDLRARCALVPTGEMQFKLVGPGADDAPFTVGLDEAAKLFREAADRVKINDRSVHLQAGSFLNELVDRAIADTQSKD